VDIASAQEAINALEILLVVASLLKNKKKI
jgi:hypothetical protein